MKKLIFRNAFRTSTTAWIPTGLKGLCWFPNRKRQLWLLLPYERKEKAQNPGQLIFLFEDVYTDKYGVWYQATV